MITEAITSAIRGSHCNRVEIAVEPYPTDVLNAAVPGPCDWTAVTINNPTPPTTIIVTRAVTIGEMSPIVKPFLFKCRFFINQN